MLFRSNELTYPTGWVSKGISVNKSFKQKCPQCNEEIKKNTDKGLLPFCSKRCKMVDLGKWLGEKYSISEPTNTEQHVGKAGDDNEQ